MPVVQTGVELFNAEANVATEWGAANAGTHMDVNAVAELKRGFKASAGATITAEAAASLSQFIAADIKGIAFASASAEVQVQMPFNLFDEMGLVVSAKAVAEASAGIRGNIGLQVGDFINLAKSELGMRGLPLELLLIFLSEVELKAGGFAKVSAAAAAHAEIRISGNLVNNPGFGLYAAAGAGLAAGAGFGLTAIAGLKNPTRMIGRMIDTCVENTIETIKDAAPGNVLLRQSLTTATIPLKIALRVAFELGICMINEKPGSNAAGAKQIAQSFTKVVLEEIQRNFFQLLIDQALGNLNTVLSSAATGSAGTTQCIALLKDIQTDLNKHHLTITEIASKWQSFLDMAYNAVMDISSNNPSSETQQILSVLWSASQLLLAASAQVFEASASASVISGLKNAESKSSYEGVITATAPQLVRIFINTAQNKNVNNAITKSTALDFLSNQLVLNNFFLQQPAFGMFADHFVGLLGSTRSEITSLLVHNIGALTAAPGQPDTIRTAALLTDGLKKMINTLILQQISTQVEQTIPADAKIYFKEILIPAVQFCNNIVFDTVVNWQTVSAQENNFKKIFQEAASSVLLMMLGKGLVSCFDILLNTVLQNLSTICNKAAANLNGNKLVTELEKISGGAASQETIKTGLEIAAGIFTPMPAAVRERFRSAIYAVLCPMPENPGTALLHQLADPVFFPKPAALHELWDCFTSYYGKKIIDFLLQLLKRLGEVLLALMQEFTEAVTDEIKKWIENVNKVKEKILADIAVLTREITKLFDDAAILVKEVAGKINDFIDTMLSNKRNAFLTQMIDNHTNSIINAFPVDILGFKVREDLRKANSTFRQLLNTAINSAFDNKIMDDVFDHIRDVKSTAKDIANDILQEDLQTNAAKKIAGVIAEHIKESLPANGYSVDIGLHILGNWVGVSYKVSRSDIESVIAGIAAAIVSGNSTAFTAVKTAQQQQVGITQQSAAKKAEKGTKEFLSDKYKKTITDNQLVDASVSILSPAPNQVFSDQPVLLVNFKNIPKGFTDSDTVSPFTPHSATAVLPVPFGKMNGQPPARSSDYFKTDQQRVFILLNGNYEIDLKNYFKKDGSQLLVAENINQVAFLEATGLSAVFATKPATALANQPIVSKTTHLQKSISVEPDKISAVKVGNYYPSVLNTINPVGLPGTALPLYNYNISIPLDKSRLRTGINFINIYVNNGQQTINQTASFFYMPHTAPVSKQAVTNSSTSAKKTIVQASRKKNVSINAELIPAKALIAENKRLITKYTNA